MNPSLCKYRTLKTSTHSEFYNSFPREDEGSPRQDILAEFCPTQLSAFRTCMTANNYKEDLCLQPKGLLEKCSGAAFKSTNADPTKSFWEIWGAADAPPVIKQKT